MHTQLLDILNVFCSAVSFLLLLYSLYFIIFAFLAFIRKDKSYPEASENRKFCILIAARNEETVIGNLIESLKKQDYPSDCYEIVVLPNNCTDNTESVAKECGARVLNIPFSPKTKGQVIDYAFRKLKGEKDIDAYVVFDADNVVDPSFLRCVNNSLASGFDAGQGKRVGKNSSDNWLTQCYEVFFVYQNILFNRPRAVSGLNASVNGTGWFVKKSVADREGFSMYTLTEDLEFTAKCAIKKYRIAYVPEAVTYDEFPSSFRVSMRQRIRWTYGQICCLRRYGSKLLKNVSKAFTSFDVFMLFISPLVQVLSVISGLASIILNYSTIGGLTNLAKMGVFSALISYLAMFAASAFGVYRNQMRVRSNIKGIILFPVFTVIIFPLIIYCMFMKDCTWKPIAHNRVISIAEKRA
ncbi:MAG: glycosyltransferase [Sphaerochaetaceae bacterium]|nr:glycosyltransferase [Sphaerochaetaceae bacterium]